MMCKNGSMKDLSVEIIAGDGNCQIFILKMSLGSVIGVRLFKSHFACYSIFKTWYLICSIFHKNHIFFIILHFFVEVILMFFINNTLKFKYPSQ